MKYTGTFLGGPYDGEIETYDTDIVFRLDPFVEEEDKFGIFDEAPVTMDYKEPRMYEWKHDDDGRGWWVMADIIRNTRQP